MSDSWPARVSHWHPPATCPEAGRSRGRPAVRWDGYLRKFAREYYESEWYEVSADNFSHEYEEDFVRFPLGFQE
eukprot:8296047-Pyramimonas_sp.AAC.1